MIQTIGMYMQFPFVRYALAVGTMIALCASLLGVTLVLKRFSFIGDGLSHVAFGAMAVAGVLRISNGMLFVLPVTVLCAVLLLRTGSSGRVKGDAAVAMISVGALAVGTRVEAYNLLIAVVVAVIIVLAMNLVGSLLISALIIFPALSAMRLFRSFRGVTLCSAALSVTCALAGMLVAIVGGTPVGSTIVAANIAVYFLFCVIDHFRR